MKSTTNNNRAILTIMGIVITSLIGAVTVYYHGETIQSWFGSNCSKMEIDTAEGTAYIKVCR